MGVKYVKDFERKFSDLYGVKHVIDCPRGTDSLYSIMKVPGIGAGAAVTKDITETGVYAGNPARLIKACSFCLYAI